MSSGADSMNSLAESMFSIAAALRGPLEDNQASLAFSLLVSSWYLLMLCLFIRLTLDHHSDLRARELFRDAVHQLLIGGEETDRQ